MRSFRGTAVLLGAFLAAGCGGDNGNGPDNQAPTASFEPPTCNQLSCTFTDGSSDPDGTIASRAWTFENGTPATSTEAEQAVVFAAAGTHTVGLTVTDNEGATDDFELEVTVTGVPGNAAPVAAFTFECSSLDCTFANTSTDADGTIASFAWDFGEPASPDNTSTEEDPSHTYTADELTTFTVTLTVTDDDGATATATQDINVSPPAGLTCDGTDCSLTLTSDASVTITLVSSMCEASGNTFVILTPVLDTLFTDGCNTPVPGTPDATFQLDGGTVFTAGTELTAEVISGLPDQEFAPTIRVTGVFPTWTLDFDDGRGGMDEPDFNDLQITVTANTSP